MPLASCPTRSLFHFATHAPQKETSGLVRIERTLPDNLRHAVVHYMQTGPNLMLAKGTPQELYTLLCPHMPPNTRKILDDAIMLARLYQAHSKLSTVRFRLEHVRTDSCRKFHTDNVRLRLLCTYFGLATEWVPPEYLAPDNLNDYGVPKYIEDSSIHKLNVGDIALLKGRAWPGHSGVVHRSPPVSHLPAPQRSRLLLTIDEPTACGMSDEQTPTIRYTAEATA
ncbi:DUF1826 domain-containing protein [Acetobacter orientalis]|uniref:DUF1826 domain-containing protein n=1 Tax=Acetobacter orientalis TaxID=146474 RepID=UPI0039EB0ED2